MITNDELILRLNDSGFSEYILNDILDLDYWDGVQFYVNYVFSYEKFKENEILLRLFYFRYKKILKEWCLKDKYDIFYSFKNFIKNDNKIEVYFEKRSTFYYNTELILWVYYFKPQKIVCQYFYSKNISKGRFKEIINTVKYQLI